MATQTTGISFPPPVAVGGIGGSGTRVVAQMLRDCGFYIGGDLNDANDNLWFTMLFRREEVLEIGDEEFDNLVHVFVKAMRDGGTFGETDIELVRCLIRKPSPPLTEDWLSQRTETLLQSHGRPDANMFWGWKEPNTHVVIDRLLRSLPSLKYVHVIRNGLDMAFSDNQNQLHRWGQHFLGPACGITPHWSLRYWHFTNRRITEIFKKRPQQYFVLNFDRLCEEPHCQIERLLAFLELPASKHRVDSLSELLKVPSTIGRFREHSLEQFAAEDLEYVRSLGFDTDL